MTTTTIKIPSLVETDNSILKGDVFYGSIDFKLDGKVHHVTVSNHIKDTNKTYNFRVASKCKAGFISISDYSDWTPHNIISSWKKGALINVQVEVVYETGNKGWYNVFTTKGGKWYSIDRAFLEVLTVGDMRQSFPNMCDSNLWDSVNAKTWADEAFTQN